MDKEAKDEERNSISAEGNSENLSNQISYSSIDQEGRPRPNKRNNVSSYFYFSAK